MISTAAVQQYQGKGAKQLPNSNLKITKDGAKSWLIGDNAHRSLLFLCMRRTIGSACSRSSTACLACVGVMRNKIVLVAQ